MVTSTASSSASLSDADRREISEVVATYAHAIDRRQFGLLGNVFTDDATLNTGRDVRIGLDEILATMERLYRYDSTFHLLGQHRVEGGPDTATAETYCDAHHLLIERETRTDTIMKIRYADEFVRVEHSWRIATRRLHIDWTEQRVLD